MRITITTLTLLASLLAQLSAANACRGHVWEYSTLMPKLHPVAHAAPVIAEVELLELLPHRHSQRTDLPLSNMAKARIVRSIKGIEDGTVVMTLSGSCTSCGGCFHAVDIGARRLVAGDFESDSNGHILAGWAWHSDGRRANWRDPG